MISGIGAAISGLKVLEKKVETAANNTANANTAGFKASRVTFQDLPSQHVSAGAGSSQVGRGARLSTIATVFSQGPFQNSGEATDLAIGGNGFFIMEDRSTGEHYYTRAGQFTLNKEGYLVNPEGCVVQGWTLDPVTGEDQGDVTDIKLASFNAPPQETTLIQLSTNLDSRKDLESAPGASLASNWDAGNNPPIGATSYEYQTSIKVHDGQGSEHTLTVYFDRTATVGQYEFLLASDPAEDGDAFAKGAMAGAYLRGVISYDSSGNVADYVALETKDPGDTTTWTSIVDGSSVGTNDYPRVAVNFGQGMQNIELNLGLKWDGGVGSWTRNGTYTSTHYASAATTVRQSQDGYGPGSLQNVSVSTDGVMVGHYTNGQATPLHRVAIASFTNPQELTQKGGGLYAANQRTGDPYTGHPGTNGLGSIASNALEHSNVDLATEIPSLTLAQRHYEANLKMIQTEDEMLGSLLDIVG